MTSLHGPWEPLSVQAVADLFAAASFRWWISGGHALELHTGQSWRKHDDIDASLSRTDALELVDLLEGWEIYLAAAGVLSRWDGSVLRAQDHHNNLWVRQGPDEPWALDITIADGDDEQWIYRRAPIFSKPWAQAVLIDQTTGVRYLAPELQLLFKSVDERPKDDIDAERVIPTLTSDEAAWLHAALPQHHRWQQLLTEHHGSP